MMRADAVLLYRGGVLARAVTLVALPTVTAVAARELDHQPVARDLRHDRRRGHRERKSVAADDGARRAGEAARDDMAVDDGRAHRHAESGISGPHAPQARLQDVVAVSAPDLADDDRHDRGGDDLGVTILAHLRGEALRIVEAFGNAARIEDHGGDDHGTGPGSASGLIDPGHGPVVEAHQLLLAVEARRGAK